MKAAAETEFGASAESYRIFSIRFEEGKAILAELTDARSALTHARLTVAETAAFERQAWSRLRRAIGQ
jgi:hypothetical protein